MALMIRCDRCDKLQPEDHVCFTALKSASLPFRHAGHGPEEPCRCPAGPRGLVYKRKIEPQESERDRALADYVRKLMTPATAFEKARAEAADLVAKGEAPTIEQGVALIFKREPARYQQHKREVREGRAWRPPAPAEPAPRRVAKTSSTFELARARARELVTKGEAKTIEQGVVEVFKRDPALYRQHRTLTRDGSGPQAA